LPDFLIQDAWPKKFLLAGVTLLNGEIGATISFAPGDFHSLAEGF
jgi:hypothetical protein